MADNAAVDVRSTPHAHHLSSPPLSPQNHDYNFHNNNNNNNDNHTSKIHSHHPSFNPYVAGLPVEEQTNAIIVNPHQDKVTILRPAGQNSCLVNCGTALVGLFSSFALVLGVILLAFGLWAAIKHHTITTTILVVLAVIIICLSLFVTFRGLCFRGGNIASIIIVSVVLIASLALAIGFSFFPEPICSRLGKWDQTASERRLEPFALDTSNGKKQVNPIDNNSDSIGFTIARSNIGQTLYNNWVIFLTIFWLTALTSLSALFFLSHSYHNLRNRQVVEKVATVN